MKRYYRGLIVMSLLVLSGNQFLVPTAAICATTLSAQTANVGADFGKINFPIKQLKLNQQVLIYQPDKNQLITSEGTSLKGEITEEKVKAPGEVKVSFELFSSPDSDKVEEEMGWSTNNPDNQTFLSHLLKNSTGTFGYELPLDQLPHPEWGKEMKNWEVKGPAYLRLSVESLETGEKVVSNRIPFCMQASKVRLSMDKLYAEAKDQTLQGTSEANTKVFLKTSTGQVISESESGQDGTFKLSVKNPLSVGEQLKVIAQNDTGEESSSDPVDIGVEATPMTTTSTNSSTTASKFSKGEQKETTMSQSSKVSKSSGVENKKEIRSTLESGTSDSVTQENSSSSKQLQENPHPFMKEKVEERVRGSLPFSLPNLMTKASGVIPPAIYAEKNGQFSATNTDMKFANTVFYDVKLDNQSESELIFDLENRTWFLNGKNIGGSPFNNMSGVSKIPYIGYVIQRLGILYCIGYDSNRAKAPEGMSMSGVYSVGSKVTDTEAGTNFYKQLESGSNFSGINFNNIIDPKEHAQSQLYPTEQLDGFNFNAPYDLTPFISYFGKYNIGINFFTEGEGSIPFVGTMKAMGTMSPLFNIIVKARPVKIDNKKDNLKKMLWEKKITGVGDPGADVFIKDSASGTLLGEAYADDNGNFSVSVPNIRNNEKIVVTEKNATDIGTGKGISNGVEVTLPSLDNSLNITQQPKYVVMDPNGEKPTFVDEQGNTPQISGNWSNSLTSNLAEFIAEIGLKNNPLQWQWYADVTDENILKNNSFINSFNNVSLLSALNNLKGVGNSYNLSTLSLNHQYVLFEGIKNADGTWTYSDKSSIPFYIKAPKVNVSTDESSLQKMLVDQTITGSGQAGDTVTIVDGQNTWTGTVGSDGQFQIATKGLKLGDSVTITETNGTGEHSVSDPVKITFQASKNSLNITQQPKYVVMDPNGDKPTFVDDQGKTPTVSGSWGTTAREDLQALQVGVGAQNVTMGDPQYWGSLQGSSDLLKNNSLLNPFQNLSLISGLEGTAGGIGGAANPLKNLAPNQAYGIFLGMESQNQWTYATLSTSIPFYIKAPKVNVSTDESSLQKMLVDQTITGSGQAGDTVTIVDGQNTWTGTVGSDGQFQIATKGLKLGDSVTITETNGTGEHSVSDPVKITFQATDNSFTLTQKPKYVVMDLTSGTAKFIDENSNVVIIKGRWSNLNLSEDDLFTVQIGDRENPTSNWNWYGGESAGIKLLNKLIINDFNYNVSKELMTGIDTLKGLDTKKQYSILLGKRGNLGIGWDWNSIIQIPFYIKAPKVNVEVASLTNQTITGSGQAGDTVTIVDGQNSWTGAVGSDGQFQIATKGLKLGDSVTITETNGTGDKSISDPVTIRVNKNSLNITQQPKYVVMDPNGEKPTFVDDQGRMPTISGNWSSAWFMNNSEFDLTVSSRPVTRPWDGEWYSQKMTTDSGLVENNALINQFKDISLLPGLTTVSGDKSPLTDLPVNKEYKLYMDIGVGTGTYINWEWIFSPNAIPFYIKAPEVNVSTDESSLQKMLVDQTITGSGQAGDTVTIVDGQNSWTGTVGADGQFQIPTKGIKLGDIVTITETNGTGEHSVSDPVKIKFDVSFVQGKVPEGTIYNPEVTGKTVGLLFVPQAFDFGGQQLTIGQKGYQELETPQYVGVGDLREKASGWTLTAQASALQLDQMQLGGQLTMGLELNAVNYEKTGYALGEVNPSQMHPKVSQEKAKLTLGGDSIPLMTSNSSVPAGMWALKLSNVSLEVLTRNWVKAGHYQGQVKWNLELTP